MEEGDFKKNIEYIKIMLEEYKSLRSEIINKQSLLNNIVNFSFAIIGATLVSIANVVVKQEKNNGCEFIVIATAIIIPFMCGFAVIQYYLEFIYTARISRYIVAIEYDINTLLGKHLLFWESGIREWKPSPLPEEIDNKMKQLQKFMWIKDEFVKKLLVLPSTFSIIAIFSAIFSMIYGWKYCISNNKIIWIYWIISVLFFTGIFFLWYRLDKIVDKMHWSTSQEPKD